MSDRKWYDVQIIPRPEFDGKDRLYPRSGHFGRICPRCGAETTEQLDEVFKTSGYICPICDLHTDR